MAISEEKMAILTGAGIDMESNNERFMGNVALMDRFFGKFLNDPNYKKLSDAIAEGNKEDAFAAAHTLKGVCGNLSLKALEKIVAEQTEMLRGGDMEAAAAVMPKVKEEYERLKEAFGKVLPLGE